MCYGKENSAIHMRNEYMKAEKRKLRIEVRGNGESWN